MMLEIRRLRLLRELAHRRTIAAVAEALSYTPSAVSQQLSALEKEVGRPLLTRTGRGVTLTPAGQILVDHTDAVLAALERAEAALAADGSAPSGTIRLGTFPTALRPLVLPARTALSETAPAVEVCLTEVDPAEVPDLLRAGRLDLALVHEYDNVPTTLGDGVEVTPLLDETVHLAARHAPDHPDGPADTIGRHADDRWILGNPGTLCHAMALRICRSHGFEPRVAHHIDDFATVLALVASGAGVALVPQLGVLDVPAGVVLTPTGIDRHTRVAFRRGGGSAPALAAVVSELCSAAESLRSAMQA